MDCVKNEAGKSIFAPAYDSNSVRLFHRTGARHQMPARRQCIIANKAQVCCFIGLQKAFKCRPTGTIKQGMQSNVNACAASAGQGMEAAYVVTMRHAACQPQPGLGSKPALPLLCAAWGRCPLHPPPITPRTPTGTQPGWGALPSWLPLGLLSLSLLPALSRYNSMHLTYYVLPRH